MFKTKKKFNNLNEQYKTRLDAAILFNKPTSAGLQQSATDAMIIYLFSFLAKIYNAMALRTYTNSNLIPTQDPRQDDRRSVGSNVYLDVLSIGMTQQGI